MTFLKQKKGIAALAAVAVVALGAVGAYAFFTSAGSGAGSATVGSASTINLSSPNVGPLFPGSHYAAAKLAGEAIVSGFAHLYDWRAFAFRFGNTVGPRSNHGVVHDFVVKLLRDPDRLEILGDGTPVKPYVAVSDLVTGMRHVAASVAEPGLTILNVGPEGTVSVRRVAEIVIDALGLDARSVDVTFRENPRAGGGGWPGDMALVEFDTRAMRALGWAPAMQAEDAIGNAAEGIAARYRDGGGPLLTSIERRAGRAASLATAT